MQKNSNHLILSIIILIILLQGNGVIADPIADPGDFSPGDLISADLLNTRFGLIYTLLSSPLDHSNLESDTESLALVSGGVITNSGGKIGIGTTNPASLLHLNAASGSVITKFTEGDSLRGLIGISNGTAGGLLTDAHPDNSFIFRAETEMLFAISSSEKMRLNSSGNLGIGSTNPLSLLHLNKASGSVIINFFEGDIRRGMIGISNGVAGQNLTAAHPDNSLLIRSDADILFANGSSERMRLNSSGNLGIGSNDPTQRLHVQGDAYKASGGTTWATTSDVRLKNVHGDFNNGLESILQLQPIEFSYKADNTLGLSPDERQIGLSAQEVEEVIPEAVTRGENGYRSLHADPVLWAMLNAIKELKAENDALKTRIESLESN
ncbi:MAG: tail fiber domain-containing protein [Spirochaetales bacterium]|nr:tail fiber domain-containing protein [Spirochaetales bacterium]